MKGLTLLLRNGEAIEEADRIGIKPPEPEFEPIEIVFRLDHISVANRSGNKINLMVGGVYYELVYDPEVWRRIETYLTER